MSAAMQVAILGSGSAVPDPVRGNPAAAVVCGDDVLMFDCGERATVNLVKAGISPLDVSNLFFTHLHWDHIADFNYLLMTVWNCGKEDPLVVWGPEGTEKMVAAFLEAHSVDVEFVRRFVESLPDHITERPRLEPLLDVRGVSPGLVLETDRCRVTATEVEHLNLLGFSGADWAYRVDTEQGSVAFSGDTVPCDAMAELAADVDILVHEATFLDEIIEERAPAWTGHSGPRGAGEIAARAGAKQLVLTHLGPYDSAPKAIEMASLYYGEKRGPAVWSKIIADAATAYDGPIVVAEDGMVFELG